MFQARQSGHTCTPVEPEGIDHRIPGGQFLFLSFFFFLRIIALQNFVVFCQTSG